MVPSLTKIPLFSFSQTLCYFLHLNELTYNFSEFELVKQAFYTEPEDQSAWFYHRWLVGVCTKNFSLSSHSSKNFTHYQTQRLI
jgi:hypothetical protein